MKDDDVSIYLLMCTRPVALELMKERRLVMAKRLLSKLGPDLDDYHGRVRGLVVCCTNPAHPALQLADDALQLLAKLAEQSLEDRPSPTSCLS